ncbi:MAG: homoserine kinase [Gemmatimonadota bacterium]
MMRDHATAFAPGSVGNVGPGLDILGLAVAGAGDRVHLAWRDDEVSIVLDAGHPDLPTDLASNTAAIAVAAVFRRAELHRGVAITVTKGLPLSGGQGGSAASAVAGAVAANHLAGADLGHAALLACALEAESTVAGRHADNLAPSLLGGLVLVRSMDPMDLIRVPLPDSLRIVMTLPEQQLRTRDARAVLPAEISRAMALQQAANVAAMVVAAALGDLAMLGRALDDQIAEPARAPLLPGFLAAKSAALAHGALGCSISGAGPTAFALVDGDAIGAEVAAAMVAAYAAEGMPATARVARVDNDGAQVW